MAFCDVMIWVKNIWGQGWGFLAQMGSRGSGGEPLPNPVPEVMEPQSSELIRWLGLDQILENEWLVRLAGAAVALLIVILLYLFIWRLLYLGRKRVRALQEFDQLLERLVRWLYVPLALVFVIQQSGIGLGNVWSLVAGALAMVALGLIAVWAIPSNGFSAFMILSSRYYKVGDVMEIGDGPPGEGLFGTCREIGLIYTTLEMESPNGKGSIQARVPNSQVFQKQVFIYTDGAGPGEETSGENEDSSPTANED